ncbi:MAG: class I SAM-dependent methyltransferase [Nanoarchaeota archaeon]|nr:class I SAM-dependent methyltransferase [Nanoarchaeota archaeon]
MSRNFSEYYKNRGVVDTYDSQRLGGLKGKVTRKLEYVFVDMLTEIPKKQKILEIGVGTGFFSKMLAAKGNFTGLDISEEMLKKTKRILPKSKFVTGNILDLRLKDKYDKVITIRVISHFDKTKAGLALKNINKVVKKGGEVIFNLENRSIARRILRKITNWGSTYTYQYNKRDMQSLIKSSGFDNVKVFYLDHFFILPLHLINKLLFNSLEEAIFNLEMRLKHFAPFSNTLFIKCRKQYS